MCPNLVIKFDSVLKRNITFPCGTCPFCIQDKIKLWSLRCGYETITPYGNSFLTLSYDDNHVPIASPFKNNFRNFSGSDFADTFVHKNLEYQDFSRFTLCRRDIERFLDNLRKKLDNYKFDSHFSRSHRDFKYFLCGEYGDRFGRPHYHLALFGLDFQEMESFYYSAWNKRGLIKSLPILNGCVRYICKYFSKQNNRELKDIFTENYLESPFVTSSKSLGSSLFYDHAQEIRDNAGFFFYGKNFLHCPTYWQRKIITPSENLVYKVEKNHISRFQSQKNFALSRGFSSLQDYLDNTNFSKILEFNSKQLQNGSPYGFESFEASRSFDNNLILEALS